MIDPNWARAEALFLAALEQPEATRRQWVLDACRAESKLCEEVLALLEADRDEAFVLDQQAIGPATVDPMIGERIGAYRIESLLGEGGMGVVYQARRADDRYQAEVAIKLVRRSSCTPEVLRRFEAECRALAILQHPHVAKLIDAGTTADGIPYLVMELIDGQPLTEAVESRRLDVRERLRLFIEICRAVHYAHQNLVIHRDLKPRNILVDAEGRPKLLDFGIAKILDSNPGAAGPDVTATIHRALTPEYASPEQLHGDPVTTASDVYSLGVILYGLLLDCSPYESASRSLRELEIAVAEHLPRRPSTRVLSSPPEGSDAWDEIADRRGLNVPRLRRMLQGDLDTITLTALRKEPERRYASAERLAEDVERFLMGRPIAARAESVLYVTRKFLARNRGKVAVFVLSLALLAASTAVAAWLANDASKGWRIAQRETTHARTEATSSKAMAGFLTEVLLDASEQGSLDHALVENKLKTQVRQVQQRYSGDPHLQANLLDGLGRVAMELGHLEQASRWIEDSRAIRDRHFEGESLEVALSLESVALLALEEGRLAEAEKALRERLRLHQICEPGVHTDVAAAMNDLGVVLRRLGATREAESLHEAALQQRREISGSRSPVVAESLNNLAAIHLDRSDFAGAEQLLYAAMDIRQESLGEGHPLHLQSLSNWATCLHQKGDLDRAEQAYLEAIEGYRALSTTGRSALSRTLSNHAMLQLARGEVADAEEDLREAIEIQSQIAPGHPDVVPSMLKLEQALRMRGAFDEASVVLDQAEEVLARHPDLPPRLRGLVLQERGTLFLREGKGDLAMEPLLDALDILERHCPEQVEIVEIARATLGLCFEACDDQAAAEECLTQAHTTLAEILPPGAGSLGQVQRELERFRQRMAEDS